MTKQDSAATESNNLQPLENALAALQATASQFSASCINDARASHVLAGHYGDVY